MFDDCEGKNGNVWKDCCAKHFVWLRGLYCKDIDKKRRLTCWKLSPCKWLLECGSVTQNAEKKCGNWHYMLKGRSGIF